MTGVLVDGALPSAGASLGLGGGVLVEPSGLLSYGDLVIDLDAWEVRLRGNVVDLTKTEFEILAALASRPRRVVTHDNLTSIVWGENWFADDGKLAVHISKLRTKLGESGIAPCLIRTVRGVGYRFEPEPGPGAEQSGLSASGERAGSPTVSWLVSMDRTIQWVSPQARDLLGWNPEDLIGVGAADLAHDDDRPALLAARPALNAGQPMTLRARFRTADGGYRELAAAIRPVRSAGGSLTGFLAELQPVDGWVGRDALAPVILTSTRPKENSLPVTLIYDVDLILVDVSPRVPIIDWEPDDIIGRYFSPFDSDEAAARALIEALLADGTRHIGGVMNVRCRDGSLSAVHSHTIIELDPDGAFTGCRTTLHLPQSPPDSELVEGRTEPSEIPGPPPGKLVDLDDDDSGTGVG